MTYVDTIGAYNFPTIQNNGRINTAIKPIEMTQKEPIEEEWLSLKLKKMFLNLMNNCIP